MVLVVAVVLLFFAPSVFAAEFSFIDTNFPNASPCDWTVETETSIRIAMRYDNERDAPNRASGHWHFRVVGQPGATLTLTLNRFETIWNGKRVVPVRDRTISFTSPDGNDWTPREMDFLETESAVRFDVTLPESGSLFVARMPPYTNDHLAQLHADLRESPGVRFESIGKTVAGRSLEIIQIGEEDAPFHVFLRGRAHPWEAGSSWVLDGLLRHLADDAGGAKNYLVSVLPMTNRDGVALGRTRFNINGKDLNRDWGQAADEKFAPENAALERWLLRQIKAGRRPDLAFEMHNDGSGRLHLGNPADFDRTAYLERMDRLESVLRRRTWFREGLTPKSFRNSGTLADGWLARFQIDAVVHELNCEWVEGLNAVPSAASWQLYGRQLTVAFDDYFGAVSSE